MKKENKIVIGIIILIIAALGVFLFLNKGSMDEKNKAKTEETFNITVNDKSYKISMNNLDEIGISKIKANYKKSGKAPVEKIYEGVSFASILKNENIKTKDIESVVFTAADGYTSAIDIEEALDEKNCFIATKVDGEPIDNGPYMMLLAKDQFSQRWCSYLLDVVLK